MSDMTNIFGRPPAGDENPEGYLSNDQSRGRSTETGTTYDATGEPEVTPHDVELVAEEASQETDQETHQGADPAPPPG